MVHALEIIPDLMLPGGSLIDIHPCVDPPVIEVSSREGQFQAGFLQ